MHGNSDDLPLDLSKTREVPTCGTLPCSRDGSDDPSPHQQKRLKINHSVSDPYRSLGVHGGRSIPAQFTTPRASTSKIIQEHFPGYQGNEQYGERYKSPRTECARSSRGPSHPFPLHITDSRVVSGTKESVSMSNEFSPAVIPVSPRLSTLQSAAIPASNGFSPMQSADIPKSNILDVYSQHPSVSSSGQFPDHHLKSVRKPMTDSSTVDRKSSKLRPFNDISTGMGYGMDAAQALQCVESTCHRNKSSRKSGPIGNGESSNESMDNTKGRKESPPKTDSYDSGVVGSSQVEESVQNLGSSDNSDIPRSKGQPISKDEKTDAYREKRRKNNIAAKKSRDARRNKLVTLKAKLLEVTKKNKRIQGQLADQNQQYKNLLMHRERLETNAFSEAMKYVIQRMNVSSGCKNCGHAISEIPKEH